MHEPMGAATFRVAAEAYDRYIGRYGPGLARAVCDAAAVRPGQRALDVGCGPGALTSELVARLDVAGVAAADPSPPFVEACRARHPGVRVERAPAEELAEVAQRQGTPAHLVDDAAAVDLRWLAGARRVGITAGASAPPHLVDDLVAALGGLGPLTVSSTGGATEDVLFALPKEMN
jgi:SAM-dependent methyltransferase